MIKQFFIFITVFFSFSFTGFSYVNISSCDTINEAYLDPDRLVKMDGSILSSSTTNCIYITANDFTLDCQNKLIEGNSIANTGLYVDKGNNIHSNVTVQNCVVSNWNSNNIVIEGDKNKLYNITTTNSGGNGIYFSNTGDTVAENITALYNSNYGIRIYNVDGLTNYFTNINASYNGDGLVVGTSSRIIFNNLDLNNNVGNGLYHIQATDLIYNGVSAINNGEEGVKIQGGGSLAAWRNITGTNFYARNNSDGIIISFISNSSFSNLVSENNRNNGIFLATLIHLNFSNVTVNHNNNTGLHISDNADSSNYEGIYSNYNGDDGIYGYYPFSSIFKDIISNYNGGNGIYIIGNSLFNNFSDMDIQYNNYSGVYLAFADRNIFSNSTIKNNNNSDLNFVSSAINNVFYGNQLSNSSKINTPSGNFFNYSVDGVNIGNMWSAVTCLNTTITDKYVLCTNPSNYSLSGGVYDYVVLNEILLVPTYIYSNSVFPSVSFYSFFMLFILVFGSLF